MRQADLRSATETHVRHQISDNKIAMELTCAHKDLLGLCA